MLKKLSELHVGETGLIKSVQGEGRIRRRLFDMGVTPNTTVYLRKVAPMDDPVEITIRGYELSLRKDEAQYILVEIGG